MEAPAVSLSRRRIVITRDEPPDGPFSAALRAHGFEPYALPVAVEAAPDDAAALADAAMHLDRYDWVICASVRAVTALGSARRGWAWPLGVRSAAVGRSTAEALLALGADPPPVVAPQPGADALLAHLIAHDTGLRKSRAPATARATVTILALTVAGGRRTLIDGLRAAGARVDEVEAYRMAPRPTADVADAWAAIAPQGVVVTSPSAARALVEATGTEVLRAPVVVVAVGTTTGDELARLGVAAAVSPRPEFAAVAAHLAVVDSLSM